MNTIIGRVLMAIAYSLLQRICVVGHLYLVFKILGIFTKFVFKFSNERLATFSNESDLLQPKFKSCFATCQYYPHSLPFLVSVFNARSRVIR